MPDFENKKLDRVDLEFLQFIAEKHPTLLQQHIKHVVAQYAQKKIALDETKLFNELSN
jgi:hypothetical protein